MRRFAWALLATAFLGGTGARAQTAPEAGLGAYLRAQQLVAIGPGRRINLVCMGQGSPTVILSDGGASWSLQWFKVQPVIARKVTIATASGAAGQALAAARRAGRAAGGAGAGQALVITWKLASAGSAA